jgi:hypothetical protein
MLCFKTETQSLFSNAQSPNSTRNTGLSGIVDNYVNTWIFLSCCPSCIVLKSLGLSACCLHITLWNVMTLLLSSRSQMDLFTSHCYSTIYYRRLLANGWNYCYSYTFCVNGSEFSSLYGSLAENNFLNRLSVFFALVIFFCYIWFEQFSL